MNTQYTRHGVIRALALRRAGLALALVAAAVVAVCAAHGGLDRGVIAWRAVVALFSVCSFQFSMAEMWKISGPEPLPAPAHHAGSLRDRSPVTE